MNPDLSNDVNGICTTSNNPVNSIMSLTDITTGSADINSFNDSNYVTQNDGEVASMPNQMDTEECSRPVDPPCISDHNQSIEQLSEWVNDMMSFLRDSQQFPLI